MIDTLIIKTKRDVFSKSSGVFSSSQLGEGFDFYEMREYNYGEDARKIDWLVSAKLQKPYVRIYQEEKLRNIVLVFLLGGSLYFGSKRLKIETLLEAFLLIALSGVRMGERVIGVADTMQQLPNIFTVEQFVKDVTARKLLGRSVTLDLQSLFYAIHEKSLVIFLGDFLDPIDLRLFAAKHEVIALVARDSIENTSLHSACEVVDCESLRERSVVFHKKTLSSYRSNIQQALEQNFKEFQKLHIDYLELYDTDEVFGKLAKFFIGR
ncbi:DUF58 domain-containing protein [Nitratiruptor tergarcus]|uniref:Uncharacterized conserved protein (Some members contain a von Willebrand factor type A (VWA) domain) n=1 Tax=Nitratiruptor tergarcus DSM 16512 TaxID=1069081 RepID=A0A1W1WQN3_9BACT|nr:DUF58 domain-containing protein [Nitratiruptor tergarcus]SMC08621.1 Uncharacterized conserved protein (some members contain a von Willebrand factor type A (vWA) domain) [Nitratiruptor tergarcus DSM 16512]